MTCLPINCFNVGIIFIMVTFSGMVLGDYLEEDAHPMYCFQCNSGLDIDCANIQPNDTQSYHYKPCLDHEKYNGTDPFCRKIVQTIFARDNMERVIRKCGWVKHNRLDCYSIRNEDHVETICQCFSPGCNKSAYLSNSIMLLIFLPLTSCIEHFY